MANSSYDGMQLTDPAMMLPDGGQGIIPDYGFSDSTSVVGDANLPGGNPWSWLGPYNDPSNDNFGSSMDLGGGFDWTRLIPHGGGTPSPGGGGNPNASRSPNGNAANAIAGLLPLLLKLFGGGTGTTGPGSPAQQQQQAQLNAMNQLLIDKANRQTPVHEAAMRMASAMAPSMVAGPRMQEAIQTAQTPRQTAQTDPHVLDAIHRLLNGGGS